MSSNEDTSWSKLYYVRVLKDFHTRHFLFSYHCWRSWWWSLRILAPANEEVWRHQPGGLCCCLIFKVGGRKRGGQGAHKASPWNWRGPLPMGHLCRCVFSDFLKRPLVQLESHGSKPWSEVVQCSGPGVALWSSQWFGSVFGKSGCVLQSAECPSVAVEQEIWVIKQHNLFRIS